MCRLHQPNQREVTNDSRGSRFTPSSPSRRRRGGCRRLPARPRRRRPPSRASPGRSPSSASSTPKMRRTRRSSAWLGRARRRASSPREATAYNPDYSPDGRRIVFERRFGGMMPDAIVTMGADGSSPATRSDNLRRGPMPGRQQPRLVARRQPARVRARLRADRQRRGRGRPRPRHRKRRREQRAADPPIRSPGSGKEPHDAQWSPDGTRIAVNMLNIKAKPRNGSAIYVLNADGSNFRRITPLPAQRRQPGLVARREADRLQLVLRGPGCGRDLHGPARRPRPEAGAQGAQEQLLVRARLVPQRQAHRLRACHAPRPLPTSGR